jgi:FkbM family methyltransferase
MSSNIWKLKYTARAVIDSSKALLNSHLSFGKRVQLFSSLMRLKWHHAFKKDVAELTVNVVDRNVVLPNHSSSQYILKEIFVTEVYAMKKTFHQPVSILDLGANVGLSSLYFLEQCPVKEIVCLEPDTSNFNRLQQNLRSKQVKIQLHNAAVGLETTLAYSLSSGNDPVQKKMIKSEQGEAMQFISFESLLQQHFDIIKIDIEGAEWELMDRLNQTRQITKASYWMMELHDVEEHQNILNRLMKLCEEEQYKHEKQKGIWHFYKA